MNNSVSFLGGWGLETIIGKTLGTMKLRLKTFVGRWMRDDIITPANQNLLMLQAKKHWLYRISFVLHRHIFYHCKITYSTPHIPSHLRKKALGGKTGGKSPCPPLPNFLGFFPGLLISTHVWYYSVIFKLEIL